MKLLDKIRGKKVEYRTYVPADIPVDCPVCKFVKTSGRSGEKSVHFGEDETAKIEIINESHVPGRKCYSFNICNDKKVGWCDAPISYCPYCGRKLDE